MLKRIIKRIRKIYYFLCENVLSERVYLLIHKDSMIPPKSMTAYVGRSDFIKIGKEFRSHFIDFARLEKNAKVLDVGCGIGRIAVPLTDYLNGRGELLWH